MATMVCYIIHKCMLGNFSSFCCRLLTFSKLISSKNYFRDTIRVSNGLDPAQDRQNISPDLGPNCLQRLSADVISVILPCISGVDF